MAKKIKQLESLTPEQWQRADQYYRDALAAGYSTERVDRDKAGKTISEAAKLVLNLKVPAKAKKWVESPLEGIEYLSSVGYPFPSTFYDAFLTPWSMVWAPLVNFCVELFPKVPTKEEKKMLALVNELTSANAPFFFLFETEYIGCERPSTLKVNNEGRLSCLDGPAMAWDDGFSLWYVDGVEVKEEYVTDPLNSLTLATLQGERNAETRRALMLLYGTQRYLRDTGADLVDSTPHERLYRLDDGSQIMLCNDHSTNRVYTLTAPEDAKTIADVQEALYGIPFDSQLERS